MPFLDFKGKSFVYAHHLSVPFRELVIEAKKSLPAKGQKPSLDDNLIIHGDNLHALKALLPVYSGKVDCIFIDPPYNTGNEGWCYNDNVRSPLMREWLKKSANPVEKEDLERHDKWLSMMWPRLKLLHELLADDGLIVITLDDNECQRAKLIMDEIFQEDNFLAAVSWVKRYTRSNNAKLFYSIKDTALIYRKTGAVRILKEQRTDKSDSGYANPDNDPRGEWMTSSYVNPATKEQRRNLVYKILNPFTKKWVEHPTHAWKYKLDEHKRHVSENSLWWGTDGDAQYPRLKLFLEEADLLVPVDVWPYTEAGSSDDGGEELKRIFGHAVFDNPKPTALVQKVLSLLKKKDALVLDSFAGSGTTAHAVLAQNKKDDGARKFILIETEDYADEITAERVRRVISGYKFEGTQREELMREPLSWTKLQKAGELVEKAESVEKFEGNRFDSVTKKVEGNNLVVTGEKKITEKAVGLGGSFTFAKLGPEMTLDKLLADGLPTFDALAKYVFFTATGLTLSEIPKQIAALGLIGETDLYRVYLHYKPDKAWLQSNDAALTEKLVDDMVAANKAKKKLLVFAAAKFMGQRELSKLSVDFCQLPYAIHRILGD
jgi:adenine-specific DNA-methyltransferase